MKDVTRNAISMIVGFIVLWYGGAMLNFFPFVGGDLVINAVGFTGLLIVIVVVICTCWIIDELGKNRK